MTVRPSEMMLTLRGMVQANWERQRGQAVVTDLVATLAELPGADGLQMGWGLFGVCAQLSGMLDQLSAGTSVAAFAQEVGQGLQEGMLTVSILGYELTTREDMGGSGRLEPQPEVLAFRPGIAANAESAIGQALASPSFSDDVIDNVRDRGRWAGRGMLTSVRAELPGLDTRQAGWAMLLAGGYLLSSATQVGLQEAGRRLTRTRRKVGRSMTYSGFALTGAIIALAGDAHLG